MPMEACLNSFLIQLTPPEKFEFFCSIIVFHRQYFPSVEIFCHNNSSIFVALFCFGTVRGIFPGGVRGLLLLANESIGYKL